MNKYLMAALSLKIFSMNTVTKAIYRRLGNSVGARRRLKLNPAYLERGEWLVNNIKRFHLDERDDKQFLEIGTGWMHFFSNYLRLFFHFEGALFDVWDNRQLNALKSNFKQVAEQLLANKNISANEIQGAKILIEKILNVNSFEELYRLLKFNYVLSPSGNLNMLPDNKYDLIFSIDVLEHVRAGFLEASIADYYRILKPGGYTMHQVGVDDHLTHYASNASKKQYLAYSDRHWNLLYKNDVQYFNRVSYDTFRDSFRKAGFQEVETYVDRDPKQLENLHVADIFSGQSQESLEATRVFLIYQKPLSKMS